MLKLTEKQANEIYDFLVEKAGALPCLREEFIHAHSVEKDVCYEFICCSKFGIGGTFKVTKDYFYVDYLIEEAKPSWAKEVLEINICLDKIRDKFLKER